MKTMRHRARYLAMLAASLCVIALAVAACGSSGPAGSSGGSKSSGGSYKLQFGANDPADEWDTKIVSSWASQVAKDTDNHVQIKVVPNDALGSNSTQLAAVENGSQFGYTASEGDLEGLNDLFTLPDLPYFFPQGDTNVEAVMNGYLGHKLDAIFLAHGLRNVGWISYGPRDIISKTPVETPANLKGLKMRVQPSKSMESGYQKLGADVNPIAYDQVYTAISTGVVDAMENGPTQLQSLKIYQVAHDLTLDQMIYSVGSYLISNKVFESLPKQYQAVIERDGKAAARKEFATYATAEKAALKTMKAEGTHIYAPNADTWKAAVGNAGGNFAKSLGPQVFSVYQKVKASEGGVR